MYALFFIVIPKVNTQPPLEEMTDKELTNLVKSVMNEEPIPNNCHNLRSLSALGNILQVAKMSAPESDLASPYSSSTTTVSNRFVKSATDIMPSASIINSELWNTSAIPSQPDDFDQGPTQQILFGNSKPENQVQLPKINMKNINLSKLPYTLSHSNKAAQHEFNNDKTCGKEIVNTLPELFKAKKNHVTPGEQNGCLEAETYCDVDSSSTNSSRSGADSPPLKSSTAKKAAALDAFEIPKSRSDITKNVHKSRHNLQVLQTESDGLAPSLATSPRGPRSPALLSEKSSNDQSESGQRKKKTSIFEEPKRIDFRKERLAQAKAVNHNDLVRSFCDGLSEFGPGVPDFDYYASKMQADAMSQVYAKSLSS